MPPSEATYVLQVEVLELADVVQRLLHIALVLPTPTTRTMQSSVGFGKTGRSHPLAAPWGRRTAPPQWNMKPMAAAASDDQAPLRAYLNRTMERIRTWMIDSRGRPPEVGSRTQSGM